MADTINFEITTSQPEVAATLEDLRYLVFQGMKGDQGDQGAPGVPGADGADGADGLNGVSPTVAITNITGGHRVTITDEEHPTGQSFAVMNGSGIPDDVKTALLNCFENVAWINDQGQTYYDALYAALYPPVDVLSISAVFTQGEAVIYDTDSLDTLKQYLTVTATYDDTSTGVVTNYTLSGTLAVGTSTITVLYGGKTTTFIVTVTESALPSSYQKVEYIQSTGTQYILFNSILSGDSETRTQYSFDIEFAFDSWKSSYATNIFAGFSTDSGSWLGYLNGVLAIGIGGSSGQYFGDLDTSKHSYQFYYDSGVCNVVRDDETTISRALSVQNETAPFSLFTAAATGAQNTKFAAIGKIYSCTVYTGETETLNLIPCYRKADNVIGMYDTVTETFFTNSGTGTFSKGSDV